MNTICVYCGSSDKINSAFTEAAYELGALIASRKMKLIYGAGRTGLMGAVANGSLENGGEVVGVLPKARLVELADAFVALPGGFGTLEELFEVLTWAQIGLHQKPVGLLNTLQYYNPLIQMINQANTEGFIYQEHQGLFTASEDPQTLLENLVKHNHPNGLERWLIRDD
jgi:predicted Rossmann-fold nucleotide-binding protein